LDNNFLGKFSKIFAMHKQQYYENAASVFGGIVSEIVYQIQTSSENNQRRTLLSHLQNCLDIPARFIFAKRSNSLRTPRRRCTENSSDTPSMFTHVTENPL
ncbi:MAG: hypothetical protein RR859_07270, partial [Ruthenibacterium sp.]